MQDDAWRRETSNSEPTAAGSSPFSRMSHPSARVPQPISQVPLSANTGAVTREFVEQAYQTAFGALRAYPDRYLDGIRAASQVRLGTIRLAFDDDVLAIEALRVRRHGEVDAEASSAITSRRAMLELELADASGLLETEISRARAEIAAYEDQLAGFEAQTAAFLERTTSPAGWSAPPPLAPVAAALVEAPEAAAVSSHFEASVETRPAVEFTPEPEAVAQFTPEAEAEAVAEATVADIEPVQAEAVQAVDGEAAEPVDAVVSSESPEAPNAVAESIAAVEAEADAVAAVEEVTASEADTTEAAATEAPDQPEVAAAVTELDLDADEPVASNESQVLKTTIAVRGLADVASIAAFMRLLTRASGIGSVQVRTEGPGEVFFAVSHDPDSDLTRLVRSLWPFEVRVLEARPGSMTVATRDPYAA